VHCGNLLTYNNWKYISNVIFILNQSFQTPLLQVCIICIVSTYSFSSKVVSQTAADYCAKHAAHIQDWSKCWKLKDIVSSMSGHWYRQWKCEELNKCTKTEKSIYQQKIKHVHLQVLWYFTWATLRLRSLTIATCVGDVNPSCQSIVYQWYSRD
jgi:hypothetical protein